MVHAMEHKIWAGVIFSVYYFLFEKYLMIFRVPFWPALFITILGAHFPDFDLDFGRKYHRSPITHSVIIPALLFAYYMFHLPDDMTLSLMALFFLGYASHLFLDIFPANASIFRRISLIFSNYVPGDIRGVPKKFERPLLIISGWLCVLFAVICIALILIL